MTTYIEQDCTIEHNGQTFEAGGAVVTPDFAIGYVKDHKSAMSERGVITDWHGNEIGKIVACTSTWPVHSWMGNRMHQIEARIDGVLYTGRAIGDVHGVSGIIWRGRRKASQ